MRTWVKNLRVTKELTQKQLALQLGISANYLCYIENGQRKLSIGILTKLADVFGVPVADLIAEETKLQSTAS